MKDPDKISVLEHIALIRRDAILRDTNWCHLRIIMHTYSCGEVLWRHSK